MNFSDFDTLAGECSMSARERALRDTVARLLIANDCADPRVQMLAKVTLHVLLSEDEDAAD